MITAIYNRPGVVGRFLSLYCFFFLSAEVEEKQVGPKPGPASQCVPVPGGLAGVPGVVETLQQILLTPPADDGLTQREFGGAWPLLQLL